MQNTRIRGWVELAAGVSVLVGLLLVVQELSQNNDFAKAESTRDLFQMWADIYDFKGGNDIDRLMSKSITDPGEMTDDELRRMNNFYWLVMNAELAQAVMAQRGLISKKLSASTTARTTLCMSYAERARSGTSPSLRTRGRA